MKISLEMFIYDIPTRPKVMFGQLKMHEIHPSNWRKKYSTEELTYIINLMGYYITFLESEIYVW